MYSSLELGTFRREAGDGAGGCGQEGDGCAFVLESACCSRLGGEWYCVDWDGKEEDGEEEGLKDGSWGWELHFLVVGWNVLVFLTKRNWS